MTHKHYLTLVLRLSVATLTLSAGSALRADDWTHYAGSAERGAVAPAGPRTLSHVLWIAPPGADEEFVGSSTPVVWNHLVFVNTRIYEDSLQTSNALVAFRAADGGRAWDTPLEADVLDSWSSPAVDRRNGRVLIASGHTLYALDTDDGEVAWQTPLPRNVVNASPAVSEDLLSFDAPANRVFITDFGVGAAALYAINIDPYDAKGNPHLPGDIVWSAPLPGGSGDSPAYSSGVVVVASSGGGVRAYDAATGGPPLWTFPTTIGFFGGAVLHGGFVYAATYNFSGGANNSRLYKLNAATGALVWFTPCERTSSSPVVVGDGRIYIAGGINGFGSTVKLQAFMDSGSSAALLWDSIAASGGAMLIGSWTHQPAYADGYLYVGTPPAGAESTGAFTSLHILNPSVALADAGFVVSTHAGAGGSPALADDNLYSIGVNGLTAFGGPLHGDANCDGLVNNFDIDPFVLALLDHATYVATYPGCDPGNCDANADGLVNNFDIDPFVGILLAGH